MKICPKITNVRDERECCSKTKILMDTITGFCPITEMLCSECDRIVDKDTPILKEKFKSDTTLYNN